MCEIPCSGYLVPLYLFPSVWLPICIWDYCLFLSSSKKNCSFKENHSRRLTCVLLQKKSNNTFYNLFTPWSRIHIWRYFTFLTNFCQHCCKSVFKNIGSLLHIFKLTIIYQKILRVKLCCIWQLFSASLFNPVNIIKLLLLCMADKNVMKQYRTGIFWEGSGK